MQNEVCRKVYWPSLVIQWLWLCAGGTGSISSQGTKISQVVKCGQNKYTLFLGFPCGSAGKESACNAGDSDSIPRLGRSPGEGKGYPLQYSGLENSKDCIVHGVAKSWMKLSDFHSLHFSELCLKPFCFSAFLFHGNGLDPCLLYNVMNLDRKSVV